MRKSSKGYYYVNLDGRQYHLGRDFELAEEKYNRLIVKSSLQSDSKTGITVKMLCDTFIAYALERFGRRSGRFANYSTAANTVKSEFGELKVDQFGPGAFRKSREILVKKGRSRQYVNQIGVHIRAIFRWGVSHEIVSPNTLVALQAVRALYAGETSARETEPKRPVEQAVVDATIANLSSILADMVSVQLLTGMRPSEVCELCVSEIDRSAEVWVYTKRRHKNAWRGLSRTVYLGPQAQEIITPYLAIAEAAGKEYLFSPRMSLELFYTEKRASRKTKVQPSQVSRKKENPEHSIGDHYTRDSYRRAIARAAARAGVPAWSPNQLRHSAGTEIRRRYGIEAACAVLGHESISTTEIYAERNESLARKVAEEIG
ncbi:MAG: site-specific integrase [Thermoguttaceae bacterium]|nr:site-specific integrase [Thermoguttaceae bacterium]